MFGKYPSVEDKVLRASMNLNLFGYSPMFPKRSGATSGPLLRPP